MTHATQLSQINAIASTGWIGLVNLSMTGAIALFAPTAIAQSIQAANDGIGTQITTTGNQIDIQGGSLAGQNLIQSFEKFGLTAGETANFLTDANIQNVLGRVVGGEASLIDGRLQISGSNANLYLLNPAGVVFGSNASLNLPASFSASTANSIDFANGSFSALGDVNLSALTSDPTGLSFAGSNGSIVNAAELAVAEGQSLSLTGDSVVNRGSLSAPGGDINVAAIAGTQKVRISANGSVLGLGVAVDDLQQNSAASLVELVAGASDSVATGVVVAEDGSIRLGGSDLAVPVNSGTAVASGELSVAGETGGTIQVLGDQVALVDAQLDASGQSQGGTVLVGGNFQGNGPLPNAQQTFVGLDSQILANGSAGDGGRVIVWADGSTQFYGQIAAQAGQAQGDGGFVEVSGKDDLVYRGNVNTSAPSGTTGTLLLDPTDITITAGAATDPFNGQVLMGDAGPTIISRTQLQSLPGNTNVIVQASNSIMFEPLGNLRFAEGAGTISFEAGGPITMQTTDTISAPSRDLSFTGSSLTLGTLNTTRVSSSLFAVSGDGGDLRLTATDGDISINNVNTMSGINGDAGAVNINAQNGSFAANVIESLATGSGQGGNVTINAPNGISVNLIDAKSGNFRLSSSRAGTINLNGNIQSDSVVRNVTGAGSGVNSGLVGSFDTLTREQQDQVRSSVERAGGTFNNLRGLEALVKAEEHWNNVMRDVRAWDQKSSEYYFVGPGSEYEQ